ncbi:MAG: urea amidolyase family protein [Thermus sp.]|uniref:5-oxoprolinase subunit B/C family protein n=1 Tax=Thermus sp. TaxID=275 RepID=UPI0025CFB11E|nr:urea amidolyase family protein [Thermus sp.]MCS6869537.1 urea amidolyase family protein [Thermus sp.]MCS7218562.1 urea amidolyase family protein [Thermus sp.]MCX7849990.1 urea amidolyase family protein [Thermus sp.]
MEGLYLVLGGGLSGVSEEAGRLAQALARFLLASPPPGLREAVPAYSTLYLEYDPALLPRARLLAHLRRAPLAEAEGREVILPVRYDGEDLPEVARRTGLSLEEVKRRHQAPLYRVYALGFTPGFPFMAPVDEALRLPRRPHPRPRVPAHAVAMAGPQTGVYPLPSPGGWHLLGTALVAVYDPHRSEPFLLQPGDRVRFREAQGPAPPEPLPLELLPPSPRLPALRVEEEGLLDLVVDGGRFMAAHLGLARSGPLDPYSAHLANRLVGNPPGAPLLEVAYRGPVLTALRPLVAAVAGYGLVALLEGEEIPPGQSFFWPQGKTLRFRPKGKGVRVYLALAGGLEAHTFLGSASPDLRGRVGRPLRAGDLLGLGEERPVRPGRAFPQRPLLPFRFRLLPGPQYSPEALAAFLSGSFRVVRADRMGVELQGPEVPGGEGLSEATPLGGIQVPPSGRPLVLLADKGSLGGYSKPLRIHPQDLWRLGQVWPGAELVFTSEGNRENMHKTIPRLPWEG